MTSARKDIEALLRRLRRVGCTVDRAARHIKVKGPNGAAISVSCSPRDINASRNVLRDARRFLGIEV
jgi:hypothetical protein